jgi:magnesium transporter
LIATSLRDLARRKPDEAEEYLDSHHDEWEELAEGSPHNAADILEALDEEGAADLLSELDLEEAADVLDEMRAQAAADVLEEMSPQAAATLIGEMEADQAADLLGALEAEQRDAIIEVLPDAPKADILRLLAYPPDTAGGMMTTEVASLPIGLTSGEAVDSLRRIHEELGSNLAYVYVVDDDNRLRGVVSFRDLFFARPHTGMEDVMVHDPVAVRPSSDREVVAELIERYRLLAIPVTDGERRLIGMVRFDEAMEAVREEIGEDLTQMVGAGAEETVFTPIPVSVRRRLPWITFNLLIGLMIAFAIEPFRETIQEHPILAALMPMVALLGGNSGAQSQAVIIRAMAIGDLPPGRAWRAVRREFVVGAINGAAMSALAGLAVAVISPDAEVGVVVAVAVFVSLLVAGLAGAGIPVIMRRLGLDPALASNIFLTMITDLVGFTGFLLTATLLL